MFNCCELGQIPKSAQSTLWRLVQKVQFFAFAAKGEVDAFFKSEKKTFGGHKHPYREVVNKMSLLVIIY